MIPKRVPMWRVTVIESDIVRDSFLVKPEHLKFWRAPVWQDEDNTILIHACHVLPSVMRREFPSGLIELW